MMCPFRHEPYIVPPSKSMLATVTYISKMGCCITYIISLPDTVSCLTYSHSVDFNTTYHPILLYIVCDLTSRYRKHLRLVSG